MSQEICVALKDVDAARIAVHAYDLGMDGNEYMLKAISLMLALGTQLMSKEGLRTVDKHGNAVKWNMDKKK